MVEGWDTAPGYVDHAVMDGLVNMVESIPTLRSCKLPDDPIEIQQAIDENIQIFQNDSDDVLRRLI